MKLIIYLLPILLLFSCVSAASKKDVDISELETDSDLQDALKYGINWIFEQAANKYPISNLNIKVTKVNKIQKWQENGSTYYSFDVEAKNDDATITSTYNVKCNGKSGELSIVNKWSYNIADYDQNQKPDEECESVDAGENVEIEVEVDVEVPVDVESNEEDCTDEENENEEHMNQCKQGDEVDVSEIKKDSHLKKALVYGLDWIFEKAADKFDISDSDIEFTKANTICKWEDGGDTYYYFDVEAENDDVTLNATYNVKCKSKTGDLRVVNEWKYTVDYKENKQCKEGEEVDVSEIEKNSNLKNALVHGVSWIFEKAHDKFNISTSNIVVTKIRSLCTWKEGSNDYYSFDVEAVNGDVTLNATYSGKCDSKAGKLRVVNEWRYNFSYDNKDESDDDCEDQGNDDDNNNNDNQDDGYDIEVDVDVDVEVEVDIENTTDEECEVEDDDNTDTNTDEGYEQISLSDCETDEIKDIIDQAIEYVTCKETKKIPKDDYYLKDIVSAYRKQTKDGDYYKFEVNVENGDGTTKIDLKFESEVKDDESLNVLSYWFHISMKN